ncbi:unnamed protein product [Arctia plantaginis]|uniref:Uncharacterized protein n=1 Tax=Arctia plantaginis TaxID=874455 RepID=A0A8S0ZIF5_ARCPL|nr:unnamed protein product [Arctia plantaginis]
MSEIEAKIAELIIQLVAATILHPIKYAQVLIQLGYKPPPPQEPVLIKHIVFEHLSLIKTSDGFLGCYRGLSPAVFGLVAANQLPAKIIYVAGLDLPEVNIVTDGEPIIENYMKLCRRDMIVHTLSVFVSYPFHVISIRMMASFIGKENAYCSFPSAVAAIYRDNGICGFFHGIMPKLLGDLTCVAITGLLAYHVNKYFIKTKDLRYYTVPALTIVNSLLTYPMVVVSTCMAVAESTMSAGNPPAMPKYPCWQACWMDLLKNKQLMRGCSLNLRYAGSGTVS